MASLGVKALHTVAIRGLAAVLSSAAGVITARALTPADKGTFALVTFTAFALSSCAGGIQVTAAHQISRLRHDIGGVAVRTLLVSLAFAALIAAGALAAPLLAGRQPPSWLLIAVAGASASCVSASLLGVFLGAENVFLFNLGVLSSSALLVPALVFLTAVRHHSLSSFLIVWVVASYVSLMWVVVWLFRRAGACTLPEPATVRPFVRFAAVAGFLYVVNTLVLRSDSFVISIFESREQLGIYSVAVQCSESLWLLTSGLGIAAFARIGSLPADESARLVTKVTRHLALLMMPLLLAILAGAELLLRLFFGAAYADAAWPLRMLVVGTACWAVCGVVGHYFMNQMGRPGLVVTISALGAVLQTAVCVILVPRFGINGAAASSTIAYIVASTFAVWLFCRRTHTSWVRVVFVSVHELRDYIDLGGQLWGRVQAWRARNRSGSMSAGT